MKGAKILLILGILLVGTFFVAAQEYNYVCCEKTTRGYCQDVLHEETGEVCLDGSAATTSCEQTSFCRYGTCVNTNTGECTPNVPQLVCEDEGGVWYDEARQDLAVCERGCCQIGEGASFVSEADCKRIATEYGVNVNFRSDIKNEATCVELAESQEYGACVIETTSKACSITTKDMCQGMRGVFYKDLLCTAEGLSDCARSTDTACFGDDVYFLDTCGNKANVFDAKKTKDVDYWEKMQDPDCFGKSGCGDCDYALGSVCEVNKGKAACKDLSCIDADGNKREHGESWCASSAGIYSDILVDPFDQSFVKKETRGILENGYQELNIPGSRYYKLECQYGEIIQEDCMDFRNGICKETKINNNFDHAVCITNTWRECFDLIDKTTCESDKYDCKWVGGEDYYWGYTFNGTVFPYKGDDPKKLEERNEKQGSCVPLYAPGFDFWGSELDIRDASSICSLAAVEEAAVFETSWTKDRDDFEDKSIGSAIKRCFDGACYAIPDFGLGSDIKNANGLDLIMKIHKGGKMPNNLGTYMMSERQGYYCPKKTGSVDTDGPLPFDNKKDAGCASSASKRADIPLFLNHGLWVDYIQERARSIGDCGYKVGISGEYGQEESERIVVAFQKLDQKGEVTSNEQGQGQATKIIYSGDKRVDFEEDYRGGGLIKEKGGQSFYWRTYGWWKKLHPGVKPNLGEKVSFE